MEEFCAISEEGEGVHSRLFCERERGRGWKTWIFDWDEQTADETWDEMLFGGGGEILGFNWNETAPEQIWEKMYFAGGRGVVLSLNEATFEQIWDDSMLGEEDMFCDL